MNFAHAVEERLAFPSKHGQLRSELNLCSGLSNPLLIHIAHGKLIGHMYIHIPFRPNYTYFTMDL